MKKSKKLSMQLALTSLIIGSSAFAEAPKITSQLSMRDINKLTEFTNSSGAQFGYSVSLDGNTLVAGARYDDKSGTNGCGSVSVFTRSSSTMPFVLRAKLSNPESTDDCYSNYFGESVDISGDTIVVGAEYAVGSSTGAVYIFEKPNDGNDEWVTTNIADARLNYTRDDDSSVWFGGSVAIDGDTIVVGHTGKDMPHTNSGAVCVYEKGAGWTNVNACDIVLTHSSSDSLERLGTEVDISGDTIIASTKNEGTDTLLDLVYVFEKPSSGGWVSSGETAILSASDGSSNERFGHALAIEGDTIIIGSEMANTGQDGAYNGAAYIFKEPYSGWGGTVNEESKITHRYNGYFGSGVDISGDKIVIGAKSSEAAGTSKGAAFVYERIGTQWHLNSKSILLPIDGERLDYFGTSVAIDTDTVAVGSPEEGTSGSVYTYKNTLLTQSIPENQTLVLDIEASDAESDTITYSIHDGVDNDFFSIDASSGQLSFINAPDFENPQDNGSNNIYDLTIKVQDTTGASRLYLTAIHVTNIDYEGKAPKALTFDEMNELQASESVDGDVFGHNTAIYGSFAILGAKGMAYIYENNGDTFVQKAILTIGSDNDNIFFQSVGINNDIALLGVVTADNGEGAVYLYKKPSAGWEGLIQFYNSKLKTYYADTTDSFGANLDLTEDTIVVGASLSRTAYVFEEPSDGWKNSGSQYETAKLEPSNGLSEFGKDVAISGDTIVVGSFRDVFLFEKSHTGWIDSNEAAQLRIPPIQTSSGKVDIIGNTVIAGTTSYLLDDVGIYVFEKPTTGWRNLSGARLLELSNPDSIEHLWNIALGKDIIALGTNDIDELYLFEKPISGWGDMTQTKTIDTIFTGTISIYSDTIIATDINMDTGRGSAKAFKDQSNSSIVPIIMYLLN